MWPLTPRPHRSPPADLCIPFSSRPGQGWHRHTAAEEPGRCWGYVVGGSVRQGGDGVTPAAAGSSGTRPLRRGKQNGPLCGCTCGTSTTWPR